MRSDRGKGEGKMIHIFWPSKRLGIRPIWGRSPVLLGYFGRSKTTVIKWWLQEYIFSYFAGEENGKSLAILRKASIVHVRWQKKKNMYRVFYPRSPDKALIRFELYCDWETQVSGFCEDHLAFSCSCLFLNQCTNYPTLFSQRSYHSQRGKRIPLS